MKCNECNNKMEFRQTEIDSCWGKYGLKINGVNAYVCLSCGNKLIPADEIQMIEKITRSFSEAEVKPDYLNISETADMLRLSNQSVYNMIKDGRIKAVKCGREWRILRKFIESAMQNSNFRLIANQGGFSFAARSDEKLDKKDTDAINDILKDFE